ncbi:hypothetical protein GCM10023144_08770 [Pigmentiphaga soli]|uniref:DUF2938 family protein n=1 Tax=Pigmentiphaga soli TaxID=1007095 RepID=A0ABP8GK83_9BURK
MKQEIDSHGLAMAKAAWSSGSMASLASTAMLAWRGARDCDSVFAPVNAVSHWLWEEEALHQQRGTLRHTVAGYAIHHAMSVLWATVYERLLHGRPGRQRAARRGLAALAVTAVACAVDLKATPRRFTPGFERRLDGRSLALVYLAFAAGLALARPRRRG